MIRLRGQGKYELLSTACDDGITSSDQGLRVEGILNKRRDDDVANDPSDSVQATTSFSGTSPTTTSIGPRHRKSSRGDSEEKKRLLARDKNDGKPEMMELSQKMVGTKKSPTSSSPSVNSDFIEVNINDDDTLQGLALKFRCPISELKRVNNIYSTQDIHSFKKIKVPVKKHGLLKEILDDDTNKRNRRMPRLKRNGAARGTSDNVLEDSVVLITDDQDVGSEGKLVDLSEEEDESGERRHPDSAYNDASSSPTCRYGIKDLENLFPNRDISDCESGAESRRRLSTSGGGSDSGGTSDSASAPLVRTFYLSIRENMSSSPNQSRLAEQFLSKMDADLSSIRQQRPTAKNSLDDVTTTLTSKRIHPLASSPPPPSTPSDDSETYGRILGMSWRTLLAVAIGTGLLLFFVFFNYARQKGEENSAASHVNHKTLTTKTQTGSHHHLLVSNSSATPGLASSDRLGSISL